VEIECLGLPGVGKTTFLNKMYLGDYHVIYSKNPDILTRVKIKACLLKLYWIIIIKGWKIEKNIIKKLAYRLSFRLKRSKKCILYFDSGLVQVFLEHIIYNQIINYKDYLELLEFILRPYSKTLIIYIFESEIEKIISRELNRPSRRFYNLSKEQLRDGYNNSISFFEFIKKNYNYKLIIVK
jgi:GTPase SAR1 family protein